MTSRDHGTDTPPSPEERLLLRTLDRMHREDPLAADFRTDAVVVRVLESRLGSRPRSHRGAGGEPPSEDALRSAVSRLAARGALERRGRRVALPGRHPRLGVEMRARADSLLATLRELGANAPPTDRLAARFGLPVPVVEFLRRSGELVSIGPGVDYPPDVLRELALRVDAAREAGVTLSVARTRDAIGGSRRHAEALLAYLARP